MKHQVNVWRVKEGKYLHMWKGLCSCGHDIQYWNWGATLGAMLHHLWKAGHR